MQASVFDFTDEEKNTKHHQQGSNSELPNLEDCDREVGAVVLRGNRMVLARSLKKDYKGLRIPSLPLDEGETPEACAIRAIAR